MIAPPVFEPFLKPCRYKVAYGGRGCYPAETEFMTPNGWKRIDEYEEGDQVLIYDPKTKKDSFSSYCEYVNLESTRFIRFKGESIDFITSINHTHLVKKKSSGEMFTFKTFDFLNNKEIKDCFFLIGDGCYYDIGDVEITDVECGNRMYCFTTPTGFFPVRQNDRIYVSGNSSKSWSIARILIEMSRRTRVRVLCARELQSSIQDSVIQLLADTIERNGYLKEFSILKSEIIHNQTRSRFMFYGIRHNITKIKSVEGVDVVWCEEAENIQRDSWEVLIPTIRKENSEIWVSFNPKNILDDTYQRFIAKPPENSTVIKVNYTDNPHFPETLKQEMEECKNQDHDLYRHVWLGEPVADSEHAIIKPSWVEAAIDAHIKLEFSADGKSQVGYDVADEGEDASAMVDRIGSVVQTIMKWDRKPSDFCTTAVYSHAYLNDRDLLVYDSIGVGAAAKVVINRMNKDGEGSVKAIGFNAGGKIKNPLATFKKGTKKTNKDMFCNVKAQEWWELRERFYNTYLAITEKIDCDADKMISLPSSLDHLDILQAELSRPRVAYDNNGRVKVESKIDMKKRGIPSPNIADALVMAFCGAKRGSARLIC